MLNGTTHNGDGGGETIDDGKTFRGYGDGDWLTLHLKRPCDLSEVRTFAGHSDARASQHYTVLVAIPPRPRSSRRSPLARRNPAAAHRGAVAGQGQGRRGGAVRVPQRAAGVQRLPGNQRHWPGGEVGGYRKRQITPGLYGTIGISTFSNFVSLMAMPCDMVCPPRAGFVVPYHLQQDTVFIVPILSSPRMFQGHVAS